ncbi:DMT family protein [Novosphingobium sp. PASSN1]|uniref:DMT family protein n=1 Tax=Novosphingobium sp. PASSN1 TaxID=2015561 RepID=UPI000BC3DD65|nr:DMT family protein [Novosphingobium sp. PASSN1]OYU37155.1 MAG: hypothetical protein CFE35_01925 [Novosphingobium sp. PASSN1]
MLPTSLWLPPVLLIGSNIVMNVAWYAHLKAPHRALWIVILSSWALAFFEYMLAVPANRIGAERYSLAQLKTMQEAITLVTFIGVAYVLFGARPNLSQLAGFVLIVAGAALIFRSPLG